MDQARCERMVRRVPTDVMTEKQDLTRLLPIVHRLRASFAARKDEQRVERSELMAQKWMNRQVVLAFAGHFSAGKSTLINTLLGRELLPSSPLPTSANVVRMEFGYPHAEAFTASGEVITLTNLSEEVANLCRDGEHIDEVRIYSDTSYLQDGYVLIDTPGVDSTDPRHAEHTQKILYLANLVVYVADYNHVLSDMNLTFMRSQTDSGKQLVLVVNQIDKHNDFELPFEEFVAGIEQALAQWRIHCQGVYYVSALDHDFPGNQLELLQNDLPKLSRAAQTVVQAQSDLLTLIHEHDAWLSQTHTTSEEEMSVQVADELLSSYTKLSDQIEQEQMRIKQQIEEFSKQLTAIPAQAIIMPYDTTELAVAYIESLSEHFRVGFFTTAAKVAAERERRLENFVKDLTVRVEAGITLHLQQVGMQTARDTGLLNDYAANRFSVFHTFGGVEFVQSCVADGARRDRDYGYQFAKRVEEAIRDGFLGRVREVTERFAAELQAQARPLLEELLVRRAQLEQKRQQASAVVAIAREQEQWINSLRALVKSAEEMEGLE